MEIEPWKHETCYAKYLFLILCFNQAKKNSVAHVGKSYTDFVTGHYNDFNSIQSPTPIHFIRQESASQLHGEVWINLDSLQVPSKLINYKLYPYLVTISNFRHVAVKPGFSEYYQRLFLICYNTVATFNVWKLYFRFYFPYKIHGPLWIFKRKRDLFSIEFIHKD